MGFRESLRRHLDRHVESIFVLPLSGTPSEFTRIDDAIRFISEYNRTEQVPGAVVRYEVNVRYSNGDEMRGTFQERKTAIEFLESISG